MQKRSNEVILILPSIQVKRLIKIDDTKKLTERHI